MGFAGVLGPHRAEQVGGQHGTIHDSRTVAVRGLPLSATRAMGWRMESRKSDWCPEEDSNLHGVTR